MKPAAEDLAAREPVWEALSEMFLDTDTSIHRQWRAERLAASRYTLEQIELILVDEVCPICKYNLLVVAGEWAAFDPDWLRAGILARLRSRFRFLHTLNPRRRAVLGSAEWQATRQAVLSVRRAGTARAA